jgi:hypothetical protein
VGPGGAGSEEVGGGVDDGTESDGDGVDDGPGSDGGGVDGDDGPGLGLDGEGVGVGDSDEGGGVSGVDVTRPRTESRTDTKSRPTSGERALTWRYQGSWVHLPRSSDERPPLRTAAGGDKYLSSNLLLCAVDLLRPAGVDGRCAKARLTNKTRAKNGASSRFVGVISFFEKWLAVKPTAPEDDQKKQNKRACSVSLTLETGRG